MRLRLARLLIPLFSFFLALSLGISCTRGQQTPPRTQGTDTSQFPVDPSTSSDDDTTSDDTTANGNGSDMWNQNVGQGETYSGTPQWRRPSQQELYCYNYGFNQFSGGQSQSGGGIWNDSGDERWGTSSSQNACLDPRQTGTNAPITRDTMYGWGNRFYGDLDYCLQQVLQEGQRALMNGQDPRFVHLLGRIYDVRCVRMAARDLSQRGSWNSDQMYNFNTMDQTLGGIFGNVSHQW